MSTDDKELRSIKRGDREQFAVLGLSPTEIGLVYFYWYEEYVGLLKADGKRFPGTATAIAKDCFGRDEERQVLYKNPYIKVVHKDNLAEVGQDARSTKVVMTKEEALESRADQLDSVNSGLQEKVDILTEDKKSLEQKVKKLERDLEGARAGKKEEKAAIDHLFETGRRVWL